MWLCKDVFSLKTTGCPCSFYTTTPPHFLDTTCKAGGKVGCKCLGKQVLRAPLENTIATWPSPRGNLDKHKKETYKLVSTAWHSQDCRCSQKIHQKYGVIKPYGTEKRGGIPPVSDARDKHTLPLQAGVKIQGSWHSHETGQEANASWKEH